MIEDYPPGTVRYTDRYDNSQVIVSPGNTMYSSALMIAEHWWKPDHGWVSLDTPAGPDA